MGLLDFLRGGQNPHLIWWREPAWYRTRLRYTFAQRISWLGLSVSIALLVTLVVAVIAQLAFDVKLVLGAALVFAVLFGIIGWVVLLAQNELRQAKVRATETKLEQTWIRVGFTYDVIVTETWPYEAIDQCFIVPWEALGRNFSVMTIRSDGETQLFGIPRRIDVVGLARHLKRGGVPVSLRTSMPAWEPEKPSATWWIIAALYLIAASVIPAGLASAPGIGRKPGDERAANALLAPRVAAVPHGIPHDALRHAPVNAGNVPGNLAVPPARPWQHPPLRPAPADIDEAEPVDDEDEPDSPPAAPPAPFRTWSDATGQFEVEAQMVRNEDGKVSLRRRDGRVVEVPLKRLSEEDRAYVLAQTSSGATRTLASGVKQDTKLAGGNEGWPFRHEDQQPLLGIQYGLGGWDGEQTVGPIQPIFDRKNAAKSDDLLLARPGYAVGGLRVDAKRFVNALQIIFMRLEPDGRLDPADRYTSPWIGFPTGRKPKTIGATGDTVIGVHGRHGAILNAVGLVMEGR